MNLLIIRDMYRRFMPETIQRLIYHRRFFEFRRQQKRYQLKLDSIRNKKKIKVVFFALFESVWKYGELYEYLKNHPNFDPSILVCPIVNQGKKEMLEEMKKTYLFFSKKGYDVLYSYDFTTGHFLDVRHELKPDIIFYTSPYRGLIDDRYYITQFPDILTCYVPYAFMSVKYSWTYDLEFHNLLWTFFVESSLHKKEAEKHQCIHGQNMYISGFPGCDIFLNNYQPKYDVWKIEDRNIKRIIWAPHHLLHEGQKGSNFLDYYAVMLEIANLFRDKIQIAFKPHPLLKLKLKKEKDWGEERTEFYYKQWQNLPNGQLEEGVYVDLFLTSDALIHDCGSFITEYLYTQKPSLFMFSKDADRKAQNEYGRKALDVHYISYNRKDLLNFINNVVIDNNDYMKGKRLKFLKEIAYPPNGKLAAQNIMDYLVSQFNIK